MKNCRDNNIKRGNVPNGLLKGMHRGVSNESLNEFRGESLEKPWLESLQESLEVSRKESLRKFREESQEESL